LASGTGAPEHHVGKSFYFKLIFPAAGKRDGIGLAQAAGSVFPDLGGYIRTVQLGSFPTVRRCPVVMDPYVNGRRRLSRILDRHGMGKGIFFQFKDLRCI